MLLSYIDESGINQKHSKNVYKDGPYIIYTAVLIPENKYFHLERLFYGAVYKLLGIKDWRNIELHATDIWNRVGYFSKLSEDSIRIYFEELFQLLNKLSIHVVIGIQQKKSQVT